MFARHELPAVLPAIYGRVGSNQIGGARDRGAMTTMEREQEAPPAGKSLFDHCCKRTERMNSSAGVETSRNAEPRLDRPAASNGSLQHENQQESRNKVQTPIRQSHPRGRGKKPYPGACCIQKPAPLFEKISQMPAPLHCMELDRSAAHATAGKPPGSSAARSPQATRMRYNPGAVAHELRSDTAPAKLAVGAAGHKEKPGSNAPAGSSQLSPSRMDTL